MRASETGLHARMVVAMGIVACLALGACRPKSSGTGNQGAAADGPTPAPEISSPSDYPSPSGAGGGGATSGGGTSGDTKSNSGTPLTVTAVIDPTPATVVSNDCPYGFTLRATVSVNKGPVDLKYQWLRVEQPAAAQPLHFDGTGPQSKVVTLTGTAVEYDVDVHLTCGVRLSAVQPVTPPTHCPYVTDFTVKMSAVVGQRVTYEWHLGDGTVVTGTMFVPGNSIYLPVTASNVKVAGSGLTNTYHITLKVTSLGGGTATGTVQCPNVNA